MRILFSFLAIFIVSPSLAWAEPESQDFLRIEHPYAYATTSVQKNAAVFLTVHRQDQFEDGVPDDYVAPQSFLTSVETDVAERAELHTHIMDGDVMMMREVEKYEVKNNNTLVLEPMGHHIMLFGLKAPLKVGSEFPMSLYFDDNNRRDIMVQIVKPGETPNGGHDHNHHEAEH